MSERELPAAIEAERAVLGAVLLDSAAWREASSLQSDDFLMPAHVAAWDAARALAARRVPLDVLLLWDQIRASGDAGKFDGGLAYFADLPGLSANVSHYVDRVRDAATRRRLIAALAEGASRAYDLDTPTDTALSETRRALEKLTAGAVGAVRFGDISDKVLAAIEARRTTGQSVTGARTGLRQLDDATGGLQPGWLVIIAAETAGGKTALAMQTAINVVLAGGTALACNLEMTREELAERAIVHKAQINSQLVRLGDMGHAGMWEKATRAADRLAPTSFYLDDSANTMPIISSRARRWRARHTDVPGIMIIDFVQLLRGQQQRGQTRAQEVGTFAQDLKALAKELRVPVILVSQLNRAGIKAGRPSKNDLKESGDLENAADLIVLPWRENPDLDSTWIIVDKFRHGQALTFKARWVGRYFAFENFDEEERYP